MQLITYIITTNKNIRCYGCSKNCEKFQAEKYIDLESFHKHMKILKNIYSDQFELHFSGGEPLLHKKLEQLCKIAHEENPNITICIHTNGILMNTLKDNQLLDLTKNNNVKFSFYLHPISNYLKNYQKQVRRFQQLGIDMYWTHEHIYFNKFTLNKYNNSCINSLQAQNKLLIADGKIYPLCPFIQQIQYYLINDNSNYIEMDQLISINQINKLFLQINCSYCKNNSIPLSNLYINNYSQYKLLTNYIYDFSFFLQNPFFYKNIQESTSQKEFEMILNRYLNGQLDIFIPYSKFSLNFNQILELKKFLISQKNIDKFNLYFVSTDDDKFTQQQWFEIFEPSELKTYFLKGKSLYLAIKNFFDNSRITNYYILDVTNLNILKDSLFFSNIINNKRRII